MDTKLFKRLTSDPKLFRQRLLAETDSGPKCFADIMDPWQREDFDALDRGWRHAAGQRVRDGVHRAWLERARGHSKTLDLAVMATWTLFAARRQIAGVAAASDKDQARLLRDAIARLMSLNEWLAEFLDAQAYRVLNRHTGSTLDVLAADVASSWGLTPSFVVVDELCHWSKRDLWDSLLSSSAKRKDCMLVVISNAGFGESWQWATREAVRTDPAWYFKHVPGSVASWIDQSRLDEQRRLLPALAYKRLWLNEWVPGAGDALDPADIEACCTLDGPMTGPVSGHGFLSGLDLGVKRDHSARALLACHFQTRRVRLAAIDSWAPGPDGQVDLELIHRTILHDRDLYGARAVCFDPWQATYLAQLLSREGFYMEEVPFVGNNLNLMASTLLQTFRDRTIDLYPDELLLKDLRRLCIEEKSYGFKLTATRDEHGHADRATALAIALPTAMRCVASGPAAPAHERVVGQVGPMLDQAQRLEDRYQRRLSDLSQTAGQTFS